MIEHSLALPFFGIGMTFSSPGATAEFSKFADVLSAALLQHHLLGFEITGIPLSPLALFVVMLSKTHLTSHSRMSGSRSVINHRDYLGREDLFCTVLLCILAISS